MFGLTQLEERLIWIVVIALVIVGFAWHERSLGAAKCIQADERAAATQEGHNATILAQGVTTVYQEASEYHEAVSAPIARPVHVVCEPSHPSLMSQAATTRPVSDGTPALPGSDHSAPVPDESLGPELQAVGRDADAQVRELQDYVRRVCLVR